MYQWVHIPCRNTPPVSRLTVDHYTITTTTTVVYVDFGGVVDGSRCEHSVAEEQVRRGFCLGVSVTVSVVSTAGTTDTTQ